MKAPDHWNETDTTISRTFITENYNRSFELALSTHDVAIEFGFTPDIYITSNSLSITLHYKLNIPKKNYYDFSNAVNEIYTLDDEFPQEYNGNSFELEDED